MDENITPVNYGEIKEIKEPQRKRERPRFSLVTFAVTLVVSIIVSALSGAGGAFFMYIFLTPDSTEKAPETTNEFVIEETTAASLNSIPEEAVTQESSTTENNFVPVIEETTAKNQEQATLPVPVTLTKGEIYSEAVDSVVTITASWKQYYNSILASYYRPATSSGTGFCVTDNGYIITNNHVVEKAEELKVTDYNGKEYSAKVIGTAPENDFAVIKIDADTVPVALGNSSELKVGDDIMVIGNALGELSYTFTDGIISHLSRTVTLEGGEKINMFQTNAAINNGNSGGPVYNMDGKVVGIASAKYASETIEGLGFCIPIDDVKDMMEDIIIYGYIKGRPSLQVTLQTVTSSMSSRYGIPKGCYVVALDKNSPAYEAGLRSSDVITKLGSKTVSSVEDVTEFLSEKSAGNKINLTYYRSGEYFTISISLSEKKPSAPRTDYTNVTDT